MSNQSEYEFWLEDIENGNFKDEYVVDLVYALAYNRLTQREYELLRTRCPIIEKRELHVACKMLEVNLSGRDIETCRVLKSLPETFVALIERGLSPSEALQKYKDAIAQANQVSELGITYRDSDPEFEQYYTDRD